MHKTMSSGARKSLADLTTYLHHTNWIHALRMGLDFLQQRSVPDKFHRDIWNSRRPAKSIYLHDMRIDQTGRSLRFALKASNELRIATE